MEKKKNFLIPEAELIVLYDADILAAISGVGEDNDEELPSYPYNPQP